MRRLLHSKLIRTAIAAFGLVTLVGVGIAAPAGAQPPAGYGFDGTSHHIVGGGSDTTYIAQLNLTDLWLKGALGSSGCDNNTGAKGPYPLMNSCTASAAPATNSLGNYQHDSVSQATPTGSGAGIASLNNFPAGISYAGAANGQGTQAGPDCVTQPAVAQDCGTGPVNVDFARSSRAPSTSGGSCALSGGNELACDTFWGIGSDGVTVVGFNRRGTQLNGDVTGLTATEIFHIWNCDFHFWSDVPSLGIAAGSVNDGPIVPWGLNSSSGTYGTFNSYVIASGGAPAGWNVDGQACDHHLSPANGGIYPFENDIKPILNDVQANGIANSYGQTVACGPGLTADANNTYTGPASPLTNEAPDLCHPDNFVWFGSFGVFSAFPYTAGFQPAGYGTLEAVHFAAQILTTGIVSPPSSANILAATWPIFRILYHVTRKVDADCPVAAGAAPFGRPCNFANNIGKDASGGATARPGPAIGTGASVCAGGVLGAFCDLNVVSGDSSGAAPNSPGNSTGAGTGTLGGLGTRDVADGATTAGSATVCSPSGGFGAADLGQSLAGGGLYPNTYVTAFIAAGGACGAGTGVTVSQAADSAAQGTQAPINLVVSGGDSGAVREYTRFQCRLNTTQQTINPVSGNNFDTDISSAIKAAGFQIVPVIKRTFGSRCAVIS
jgi:hypothetical protein